MGEVERFEFDHGIVGVLHYDDSPESPREWCSGATFYCWHPDYTLGDEQFTRDDHESMEAVIEYLRDERKATVIRPLFLLDHSGLRLRVGGDVTDLNPAGQFVGDGMGWDTTHVGFAFTTEEDMERVGTDDADALIEAEVETYDQFLSGSVFGYVIEDEDGEHLDSLWGMYGYEYAVGELHGEAKRHVAERATAAEHNVLAAAGWRH